MIDVMDKHFQEELNLTLAQSAWVQFAHYLGYFLMALPAGWLATKLGYKGGIITGLLMVAAGGLWFIPATNIAQFWAFLVGVCFIAAGLTFLETIANPYTTVLGPNQYAATRINLAQSCNGIGWIFGPIAGGLFFYGKDASGASTGAQTLWIPYAGVAVVVLVLAVIFYFADVPDIKAEDDYHLDDTVPGSSHSIWKHPHFIMAVVAQFLYVAAQAGIFSFFINYMTSQVPHIPASWNSTALKSWFENSSTFSMSGIKEMEPFIAKLKSPSDPVTTFMNGKLTEQTRQTLTEYQPGKSKQKPLQKSLIQDLNSIIKGDSIYDAQRFTGIVLRPETKQRLEKSPQGDDLLCLNRLLLEDAYPAELSRNLPDRIGITVISDQGASTLASVGFICFLLGRFTGAGLLKKYSAHRMLGLYGVMNVLVCLLIFLKLGWLSVLCVFLSYFFMSIMFPTIFALGIFGLGARAKKASAYIVMAIMGGAILPKLMGYVADQYDLSRGFIVPMFCFAFVAFYGYCWPKFSKADSLTSVRIGSGH
jgi:fucose permease